MNVYVVCVSGTEPIGAFETRKLAEEFVVEHFQETGVACKVTPLEVVKVTDRPSSDEMRYAQPSRAIFPE